MTTREFTVVRRKANIVDLLTPKRPNVQGYRFRAAPTTFSGVFADLFTADISSGFLDPAVDRRKLHSVPSQDQIRCVFDPATFTGAAGILDTDHFWMTFTPVDFGGTPGTESAPGLILPVTEHRAARRIMVTGTAPNAANLGLAQQLDLPSGMADFRVTNNDGATSLFFAASQAGGEQEVVPGATHEWIDGNTDTLFVRGDGGAISITISFTNYLPL